ncbi:MAG: TrmH family RNA methyltransferase [Opitutales bacterium]|jgi:RNA methyltransferase, TrmH family
MIESSHNPEVKRLIKLRRARVRRSEGLFIVEGHREIQVGLRSGAIMEQGFFCRAFFGERPQNDLLNELQEHKIPMLEMTEGPFKKASMRENPDGLIVLARTWESDLDSLRLGTPPLVVVVDAIEKPGNLGAVLRSAEAFGIDAILCVDPSLDLFNPNVLRASQGLLFRVPAVVCGRENALAFLRRHELRIHATSARADKVLWDANLGSPTAIVVGSEAKGLDSFWLEAADERVTIPMEGGADSLNLSVAVGCLLAEARRQRRDLGSP